MISITDERLGDLTLSGLANHPFLASDNLIARATLSGSSVGADGARENLGTWTTYDRWRPALDGTRNVVALIGAEEAPVSFIAIAAHNLAEIGASVYIAYNTEATGGAWVNIHGPGAVPAQDGVMAWRIMPTVARQWRLIVVTPAGKLANVGCFFVGRETILPLPMYQGFSPRIVPTEIALESNVSEGGNLVGTAVVRTGSTLSVSLDLLPAAFVRGPLKPVMDWFNRGRGVYFAWRPAKYPEDIHYGWRSGDAIRPENAGPKDRMSAALQMRVFDG